MGRLLSKVSSVYCTQFLVNALQYHFLALCSSWYTLKVFKLWCIFDQWYWGKDQDVELWYWRVKGRHAWLITTIIWTPIFKFMWLWTSSLAPKRHVLKKIWTTRSCYANHSWLNSEHDCGDLHDHLMSTRIFTLIMIEIFIWAPKNMRQVATSMIWTC